MFITGLVSMHILVVCMGFPDGFMDPHTPSFSFMDFHTVVFLRLIIKCKHTWAGGSDVLENHSSKYLSLELSLILLWLLLHSA